MKTKNEKSPDFLKKAVDSPTNKAAGNKCMVKINTVTYSTKTVLFFCNRHGNFQNILFVFRLLFSGFQQRNEAQKISDNLKVCSVV
jgi:hypothetical protein